MKYQGFELLHNYVFRSSYDVQAVDSIVTTGSQGQRNSPKIKTVPTYTQAESKKINILMRARINQIVQNAGEIRFIVC